MSSRFRGGVIQALLVNILSTHHVSNRRLTVWNNWQLLDGRPFVTWLSGRKLL